MKKKMKKAFTLVELLVVIAILAVLSTVAIVGYNSFTEKANKSADEQLCTQYNTLLQAESVLEDEITLPDLIRLIESNGIHSHMFETKSKAYEFAYDMDNKKCVLVDNKTKDVVFPTNHTVSAQGLWVVFNGKIQEGINNYYIPHALTLSEGHTLVGAQTEDYIFDFDGSVFKVYDDACLSPMKSLTVINASVVKETNNLSKLVIDENSCEVIAARQVASATALEHTNVANWVNGLQKDVDYTGTFDSSTGKSTYTLKNIKFVSESDMANPFGTHNLSSSLVAKIAAKYGFGEALKDSTIVFDNCAFNNIIMGVQANEAAVVKFERCDFTTVKTGSYAISTTSYNGIGGGHLAEISVNNCSFNFGRSIALKLGVKLTVTNSTFNIFGDNDRSSVVMVSEIEKGQFGFNPNEANLTTRTIKLENNTVNDAYAVIAIHDSCAFAEDVYTETLLKGIISLNNNTVSDNNIKNMVWEKNMPSKFTNLLSNYN